MPDFRAFLHISTSHEKCAEIFNYCGEPKTYQQAMVTGRGQQYILARLMREYGTEVPIA